VFKNINPSTSYLRAVYLELGSVEFFALLIAILFSLYILFKWKDSLFLKLFYIYIFFIPFTDRVYRLFGVLEPAEILAIIIILLFLSKKLVQGRSFPTQIGLHTKYMGGLFLLFLLSLLLPTSYYFVSAEDNVEKSLSTPLMASLREPPIFNWLYLFRFGLIFGVLYIFYLMAKKEIFEKVIKIYIWTGSFGSLIGISQLLLFYLGYKVYGVFYINFPRIKGLAHEPATFGAFLISSLALTFFVSNQQLKFKTFHLLLQSVGLLLTMSASSIPLYFIFLLILIFQCLSRKISLRRLSYYFFALGGVIILFFVSNFITKETLSYTIGKIFLYVKEVITGQELGTLRGTDIENLKIALKENPIFGIGIFNFVFYQTSATNTFVMLLAELGIFGFSIFLILTHFFYWGVFRLNKLKAYRFNPHALSLFTFILIIPLQLLVLRVINFHYLWFMVALFSVIKKLDFIES